MTDTDKKQLGMTFPCEFPIKIFGVAHPKLEKNILKMISKHVSEPIEKDAIKERPSKDGKYLALTILITAESQEQLDNIYKDLSASPDVLMAL